MQLTNAVDSKSYVPQKYPSAKEKGEKKMAEKREIAVEETKGFGVQDLILIAVLVAAGAVLKLTVANFLSIGGCKANFMIASYCLAIILIRPKFYQSAIIGLFVGLVSQIPMLNATPLVNIASELVGAVVCGLLIIIFAKIAADNKGCQNIVFPAIITFVSTCFSGYTFSIIVGCALNGLGLGAVFATYSFVVLPTACMNAVFVAILTPVLKAVLKK